ncbi:MAG: malto-oligosyltrehalose trehalohydrolase [Candidatus Sulfotelmatobacter sp.]
MSRHHEMPFGAECRKDGSVRFRLWAPAAREVEVELYAAYGCDPALKLALERREGGWFELETDAARAGTKYRYRINGEQWVPDPASRFQPQDVNGPSEVIDPHAFAWKDSAWRGRPWAEAIIYELHVGTFTAQGTFAAARERLDYLRELGVTAIELMPVADFPGGRNWGYDGVFTFAPDSSYGRLEELKELVQAAHERGMMVFLDVVYNHFGPEGNYLNGYAPQFFTERHCTPWGNGINFDDAESRTVRDFFIQNALYWLEEYHFDGLRLDAVHAITDDSKPHILTELADAVHQSIPPERQVHLILENDRNQAQYLRRGEHCRPKTYTAQWNDDIHHALHVLVTGEHDGYYVDYAERTVEHLGRCLTRGFAYQGETSKLREGEARGESTAGVPLTAFVSFLQNHDQIGNRAFGERIASLADARALRAATAITMLAPSPPMLFMGEEFGSATPFFFFCDFKGDLAAAVTSGRRNEFARFAAFRDPAVRERIPDPNADATFEASKLNWNVLDQPAHREWLELYRELIRLRREFIVPRLAAACRLTSDYAIHGERALTACWQFTDQAELRLAANLGPQTAHVPAMHVPAEVIYSSPEINLDDLKQGTLPAWSVVWWLQS